MDFIDQIKPISEQISKLREHIKIEEATKSAFVMPLIQALGYNVFNPMEVCPEFIADAPGLKGETVNYAILRDGDPIMVFECKWCGEKLGYPSHGSQLYRYLSSTPAKFGVLTNGVLYRFYTDLEKPNMMDSKPFLEFNMLDLQEPLITELKSFSKSAFNPEGLQNVARNLMYTSEVKRIMAEQLADPEPDFVRFFAKKIYTENIAPAVMDKFKEITKRSLNEFIKERIIGTLQTALNAGEATSSNFPNGTASIGVITTEEELEGFHIVKAVLREAVDIKRIHSKDTKSYFAVLLDGNTWKTICRLYFNSKQKYIGLFDKDKKEIKTPISSLEDLYSFTSELRTAVSRLDKGSTTTEPSEIENEAVADAIA
ncbi:Prophage Lp2 protein 6 [uncultured Synechococcales cyanobacterium]|uniref:Prophage Lp2 protein 6 n=1 Tax=uncultured Synechococcales cyanobacterium TaxID=1936017 RepID=A0A6J4VXJ5_9CYAN|nr:Prophage Lp2 protein 6 [uncultured Synechococcales cyanobacterium]